MPPSLARQEPRSRSRYAQAMEHHCLFLKVMERENEVPTEQVFQAGWTELSAKTCISLGNRLWGQ